MTPAKVKEGRLGVLFYGYVIFGAIEIFATVLANPHGEANGAAWISAFLGFLICIPWFWIAAFLHFPDWATKPVMIFSVVINAWLIYKFSIRQSPNKEGTQNRN